MHPGQKLKPGARVVFERDGAALHGEVLAGTSTAAGPSGCGPMTACRCRGGHRPHRPHPAAALHQARRSAVGSRALSDGLCARTRVDRRADRRPALHAAGCSTRSRSSGVERAEVTLHVGYGTFKPVRAERVEDHVVDPERVHRVRRGRRRATRAPRARAAASSRSARRPRGRWSRWPSTRRTRAPASGQTTAVHPSRPRFRSSAA